MFILFPQIYQVLLIKAMYAHVQINRNEGKEIIVNKRRICAIKT